MWCDGWLATGAPPAARGRDRRRSSSRGPRRPRSVIHSHDRAGSGFWEDWSGSSGRFAGGIASRRRRASVDRTAVSAKERAMNVRASVPELIKGPARELIRSFWALDKQLGYPVFGVRENR